jgi:4-hydroxybenzoate polyprenyltransferase
MFFILSKILVFLIRPLTWLWALLAYALLTRKPRRRHRCLWASLILVLFFTNRPIFNLALKTGGNPTPSPARI